MSISDGIIPTCVYTSFRAEPAHRTKHLINHSASYHIKEMNYTHIQRANNASNQPSPSRASNNSQQKVTHPSKRQQPPNNFTRSREFPPSLSHHEPSAKKKKKHRVAYIYIRVTHHPPVSHQIRRDCQASMGGGAV